MENKDKVSQCNFKKQLLQSVISYIPDIFCLRANKSTELKYRSLPQTSRHSYLS